MPHTIQGSGAAPPCTASFSLHAVLSIEITFEHLLTLRSEKSADSSDVESLADGGRSDTPTRAASETERGESPGPERTGRETFSLLSPHCVGRRSAQLDY